MSLLAPACFATGCLLRLNGVPAPQTSKYGRAWARLQESKVRPLAVWLPLRMSDLGQWPQGMAVRREQFFVD